MQSIPRHIIQYMLDKLRRGLEALINKRHSNMSPAFFASLSARFPKFAWELVPDMAAVCTNGRFDYVRYEMLNSFTALFKAQAEVLVFVWLACSLAHSPFVIGS